MMYICFGKGVDGNMYTKHMKKNTLKKYSYFHILIFFILPFADSCSGLQGYHLFDGSCYKLYDEAHT